LNFEIPLNTENRELFSEASGAITSACAFARSLKRGFANRKEKNRVGLDQTICMPLKVSPGAASRRK
jgi:hypothetical protein